jgi:nucleoside-diphosphate-sugar epimerase
MSRIFIAGGTGAVGRFLVPLLLAAGHSVTACSRTAAGMQQLREQGAEAVQVDVFDRSSVTAALVNAAPELVIHQLTSLASGNSAENARIRKEGTRNLVDAARQVGVRRIVAQSIAWAYEEGEGPAVEGTALDVHAPAPRAGTIGGIVALESTVAEIEEHVILRYGTFYGPGTWYAPGGLMERRLADGALTLNEGVTSFVHVADAAQAAVLALGWSTGAVNIVDDDPAPAREWVPVLAKALGQAAPEGSGDYARWERGADNSKARSLGWHPAYPTWRPGFGTRQ